MLLLRKKNKSPVKSLYYRLIWNSQFVLLEMIQLIKHDLEHSFGNMAYEIIENFWLLLAQTMHFLVKIFVLFLNFTFYQTHFVLCSLDKTKHRRPLLLLFPVLENVILVLNSVEVGWSCCSQSFDIAALTGTCRIATSQSLR